MWRKLLLLCLLVPLSWTQAIAVGTAHGTRDSAGPPASAMAGTGRVALVIGNSAYPGRPLRNPPNDGHAMREALASLGFEVIHRENLTHDEMLAAIHDFNERLETGGVGLFYFSGHGFHTPGGASLAPVDTEATPESRLLGVNVQAVIRAMSASRPGKANLVLLDICLNGPHHTPAPAGAIGLPDETLVAYATLPGSFAADGASHGVYTAALLKSLREPGLTHTDLLARVESAVRRATARQQTPWYASTLSTPITINSGKAATDMPQMLAANDPTLELRSRAILPQDSAEQIELAFWNSVKDSNHPSDYEAYLQAYPNGRFAALARARIKRLRAAAPKTEAVPEAAAPAKPQREAPRPPAAAKKEQERPPAAKAEPPPVPAAAPARPADQPATAKKDQKELKDCPDCPVLIALSPGSYSMGSNTGDVTERPAHKVSIAKPFAIGKYEVTVGQWKACVDAGACPAVTNEDNRSPDTPVRDVSWDDAQQYVKWLSKVSGKPYRLPTEAEWEYAARGGTATRYWWGDQMQTGNANCKDCGKPWQQDGPVEVGSFAANPFGLHDVNGSVWEWVQDCWHNSYRGAPADGSAWDKPACRERVIRGGSWREGASYMPSSTRFKYQNSVRHSQNGFRVARTLE